MKVLNISKSGTPRSLITFNEDGKELIDIKFLAEVDLSVASTYDLIIDYPCSYLGVTDGNSILGQLRIDCIPPLNLKVTIERNITELPFVINWDGYSDITYGKNPYDFGAGCIDSAYTLSKYRLQCTEFKGSINDHSVFDSLIDVGKFNLTRDGLIIELGNEAKLLRDNKLTTLSLSTEGVPCKIGWCEPIDGYVYDQYNNNFTFSNKLLTIYNESYQELTGDIYFRGTKMDGLNVKSPVTWVSQISFIDGNKFYVMDGMTSYKVYDVNYDLGLPVGCDFTACEGVIIYKLNGKLYSL